MANRPINLMASLPTTAPYIIYMDNYFTSVALFKELRDIYCGACGTTRPQNGIPSQLVELKDHIKSIPWGSLYASEAQGVLCLAWQDNNIVLLLSTIHSPELCTPTKRKRPAATSTNASIARAPFGDEIIKELEIPTAIDDYNHYMGGVDIANQYRASYEIHRKCERVWFPLLFFFIDAAIVNAYRIQIVSQKQQGQGARPSRLSSQLDFRRKLYQQLFAFAPTILRQPGQNHQRIQLGRHQLVCVRCKEKRDEIKREKDEKIGRTGRSRSGCLECGHVALCVKGRCWDEWHGD
jgi:transposase IS4-like protein